MTVQEARLPDRFELLGTWTLRSVTELSDVRAELGSRLPCECTVAGGSVATAPGSLSGAERMVLVASELVSNALEHARPPVTARLLCDGKAAVVDVIDRSPDVPPVVPHDREPGGGGHGLRLAATVAERVGWYRTPGGEKHVWASFSRPVSPDPGLCRTSCAALAAQRSELARSG